MKGWKIFWLMCGLISFTFMVYVWHKKNILAVPSRWSSPLPRAEALTWLHGLTADDLSKALKVPVNVVNRAGGTGIQGVTYVVKGKKDGYTLLGTTGTPLIIMPDISKEVTYDPLKDLIPIGHLGFAPSVFAVRSDSPFKTLKELIEYARQNPGKLKNGAGGVGTESNFNLAILCSKEKIKITSVPFQSGGEAVPALLGGHVDMSSNTLATPGSPAQGRKTSGAGDRIQKTASGSIRISRRRPKSVIPTSISRCGSPSLLPTGVPQQVVDVLVPAVEKVFESPEVIQRCVKIGH